MTVNTLFSIDNPTLNRFYSLHYTLPFILAGLSIFHIAALHQYGSTNPLGVNTQTSTVPFSVYFASKDLLGLLFLLFAFAYLVFFYPELLGHPVADIVEITITIFILTLYAGTYSYSYYYYTVLEPAENGFSYIFNTLKTRFSETIRVITLFFYTLLYYFYLKSYY